MKSKIIIGMGNGAEQSHYTRKPFYKLNIANKSKTCERCNKVSVVGRKRFCNKCAEIRAREQRRDYARKMKKNRKTK